MNFKYKDWLHGVFLLLLLLCFSGKIIFAQSSTNYVMKRSVLDNAGMASQSTNYSIVDAVGQPSPLGEQFNANYTLSPGFLGQAIIIEFRGAKLYARDGAAEDYFARSVALGDEYAVVGASHNDNRNGTDAGAAYIFARSGNDWIEQAKIMADDGAEGDVFGYSVAIEGDYLVVGAPWTDDLGIESGAAYVYKRDGVNWVQQAKLTASDGGEDNRFGISVAISGDYVLVGAFFDDDFGTRSGSAYIFKRSGTSWTEQAILKASEGAEGDWFGVSVSIDGDFAAIGSRYDDNDNGTNAGGVYIFKRDGTTWNESQKIIADDGAADDLFHKVKIDRDRLVIGAYQDDDNGTNSGSVYVYGYNGATWVMQEKLIASDGAPGELFGRHFAIHKNRMVVGAYRDDDNGSNSGSIYVFEHDGRQWNETDKIIAYDGDPGDFYGLQMDLNDYFILVSARNDDDKGNNAGAAYMYGTMPTTVPFDFEKISDKTIFQLLPAYPNPFNPETTIRYIIPRPVDVKIAIYNMLGQRIRLLENRYHERGSYSVRWDGRDETGTVVTSGVYICRIQAGEYRHATKLAIVK